MEHITQLRLPRAFLNTRFASFSLETILRIILVYLLPVSIGAISLAGALSWQKQYGALQSRSLEFKLVADDPLATIKSDALNQRFGMKLAMRSEHLDAKGGWLRIAIDPTERDGLKLDIPSRLVTSLECWDTGIVPAKLIGSSDKVTSSGGVQPFKTGFLIDLPRAEQLVQEISCRVSASASGSFRVNQWTHVGSKESENEFSNFTGLIDGGLIVLAIFLFFTAFTTRESVYALLSMWLIASVRVSAYYGGWDSSWLGLSIPFQLLPRFQLLTFAIYYSLTCLLFSTLFSKELSKAGYERTFQLIRASCILLVLLSIFSSPAIFLAIFPVQFSVVVFTLLFFLSKISALIRTRQAMWYCVSLMISISVIGFAMISEVALSNALLASASLVSGLLTSFAIAEKMRTDQEDTIKTKVEFQSAMDSMPIGLFTLNVDGEIVFGNPAFFTCLNLSRADVLKWQDVFGLDSWNQLKTNASSNGSNAIDVVIGSRSDSDSRTFIVGCSQTDGQINGTIQDVSEKHKYEQGILFLEQNDPLTSVLNRFGIEDFILRSRTMAKDATKVFVAHLTVDRLKIINDLYGHKVGDALLKVLCPRVQSVICGRAKLGRVGGAQFLMAINAESQVEAIALCRSVLYAVNSKDVEVGGQAFAVKGFLGLVEFGCEADLKTIISMASRACSAARCAGGDGLMFYADHAEELAKYSKEMVLAEAVSSPGLTENLYLVMQPILALEDPHASLNFEVLLRMNDSRGCAVRTDHLIKAAEVGGQMSVIDEWVLVKTLKWLREERSRLTRLTHVFINLNGSSLNDEIFMRRVAEILSANSDLAHLLCYEITESVALQDFAKTQEFISVVRAFGSKVALDDFGAGYTSFSYLKSLTCDFLKIDGSFIVDMNAHASNLSIVEAIVTMAKSLKIRTVAEWAEDAQTVQTLRDLGVDFVQGFAVCKPINPSQIFAGLSSASFITDSGIADMFSTASEPSEVVPA